MYYSRCGHSPLAVSTTLLVTVFLSLFVSLSLSATLAADPYPIFWNVHGPGNASTLASSFRGVRPINYTQTGDSCATPGCTGWDQGHWPTIDLRTGKTANGGVPQAANLTKHLNVIRSTIDNWIPDILWSGNAVLDFEAWTTVWELNVVNDTKNVHGFHDVRYQEYSKQLVRDAHPTWTKHQIEAQAKTDFEAAANAFFLETLSLLHSLRPNAHFGFYGFPQTYMFPCTVSPSGESTKCGYDDPVEGKTLRSYTERQMPIFEASSALFPSIYMFREYNDSLQRAYLSNSIEECLRIRKALNRTTSMPIYAYQMVVYKGTQEFLSSHLLYTGMAYPYELGVDGLIVWWHSGKSYSEKESSKHLTSGPDESHLRSNKASLSPFPTLESWVQGVFGPMSQRFHDRAEECRARFCGDPEGKLRCKLLDKMYPKCVPIVTEVA